MNDADFPVARVLAGIEAAAAAGLAPVKINMVVKRGVNDQCVACDGAPLPRQRAHPALHRIHGRRHTNGWRMDDVITAAEIVRRSATRCRSSRPSQYPGEVAERWRYRDGVGEIGVIASVTRRSAATARGAPVDRRQALHLPVRARATTCERCCAAAPPTRRSAARSRRSGATRDDRYSEIRTPQTAKRARSKCPTSAAEPGPPIR